MNHHKTFTAICCGYEKLKHENQRLREALRLMLSAADDADASGELFDSFDEELLDMAREALKEGKGVPKC